MASRMRWKVESRRQWVAGEATHPRTRLGAICHRAREMFRGIGGRRLRYLGSVLIKDVTTGAEASSHLPRR